MRFDEPMLYRRILCCRELGNSRRLLAPQANIPWNASAVVHIFLTEYRQQMLLLGQYHKMEHNAV
jgi:hypothetical protein